jgi:hypothetical protein
MRLLAGFVNELKLSRPPTLGALAINLRWCLAILPRAVASVALLGCAWRAAAEALEEIAIGRTGLLWRSQRVALDGIAVLIYVDGYVRGSFQFE